jgi:hypothetical protein
MTEPSDLEVSHAYTRQAVEEYVKGVERQRLELQAAIEQARARAAHAVGLKERIDSLEHRIGESILTAHAHAGPPHDVPAGPLTPSPSGGAPDPDVHQTRPTSLWSSSAGWEQDRG